MQIVFIPPVAAELLAQPTFVDPLHATCVKWPLTHPRSADVPKSQQSISLANHMSTTRPHSAAFDPAAPLYIFSPLPTQPGVAPPLGQWPLPIPVSA